MTPAVVRDPALFAVSDTSAAGSDTDLLPPAAEWVHTNADRGWLASYLPFDTSRPVFRSSDARTGRPGCGRYVVFQLKD